MTLPKYPYEREFDRFVEDADGNVAVRVVGPAPESKFEASINAMLSEFKELNDKMEKMLNHLRYMTDIESDKGEKY